MKIANTDINYIIIGTIMMNRINFLRSSYIIQLLTFSLIIKLLIFTPSADRPINKIKSFFIFTSNIPLKSDLLK